MVKRRYERTQTVDVAAGTAQQRRTSATTAAQKAETLNSVSDRTTTCALKMASHTERKGINNEDQKRIRQSNNTGRTQSNL